MHGPVDHEHTDLTLARKLYLKRDHSVWCIVDACDYDWLSKHNWNCGRTGRRTNHPRPKLYAKRNVGKNRTTIWMARAILWKADPHDETFMCWRQADHINGQTLDNRRCNLRWATPSENQTGIVPYRLIPSLQWIWNNLCVDAERQLEDIPF